MKKLLAAAFLSLSIATGASAGDLGALLTGLGAQAISNLAAKAMGVAPAPKASRQLDEETWQNARTAEARVMLNWVLVGNVTGQELSEVRSGCSLAVKIQETPPKPLKRLLVE